MGVGGKESEGGSGAGSEGAGEDGGVRLPVMPPVDPMLAKVAPEIPPAMLYEPKWDGIHGC